MNDEQNTSASNLGGDPAENANQQSEQQSEQQNESQKQTPAATPSLDEILKDPKNQSAFDKKVAKALRPAWDAERIQLEGAKEQALTEKAAETAAKEQAQAKVAEQQSTIARLIIGKDITAEELSGLIDQYPEWSGASVSYDSGDNVRYNGKLYQCVQAHVSQTDWSPEAAASLWMGDTPANVIAEYQQPTGAHDAYKKGDRVIWSGVVYESLVDANVWSPGDAPQCWTVIPGD